MKAGAAAPICSSKLSLFFLCNNVVIFLYGPLILLCNQGVFQWMVLRVTVKSIFERFNFDGCYTMIRYAVRCVGYTVGEEIFSDFKYISLFHIFHTVAYGGIPIQCNTPTVTFLNKCLNFSVACFRISSISW